MKRIITLNLLLTFTTILFFLLPQFIITASANQGDSTTDINVSTTTDLKDNTEDTDQKNAIKKHTQIHLHLKDCKDEMAKVYVNLNGEWSELAQHGNSPLYWILDQGEFVSDDITEFKFVTITNEEIMIPVSELRIGVEAEGTINYWLDQCPKGDDTETPQEPGNENKHTQIHLHLKDCVMEDAKVYVKLKGMWFELSHIGKSPLFKLLDKGEFVRDDITAFKLVTSNKKEIIIPVSELKIGVEAKGTINYWMEKCPKQEEVPVNGGSKPDQPKPDSKGNTDTQVDSSKDDYSGKLPQTGESSNVAYYIMGLILMTLGVFLFRLKRNI